jgi:hypothetical protein
MRQSLLFLGCGETLFLGSYVEKNLSYLTRIVAGANGAFGGVKQRRLIPI